jgi:hypothetical protein
MKKLIFIGFISLLIGCKKEPEPKIIELSFEQANRVEALRFSINGKVYFENMPFKYKTTGNLLHFKIETWWLDKFRPSTVKIIIHDDNKQVFIHDVISEGGAMEYEYKYERP